MPDPVLDHILDIFRRRGDRSYQGEAVTQSAHMLQAAALAEREGAPKELVAAALLHDIGHLMHELGEDCAVRGIDDRHQSSGAAWLKDRFKPAVAEAVRLHVEAKRYLCAVDPRYRAGLSSASERSLKLQGGPMGADEAKRFAAAPHADWAIRIRRWDDAGKVPGAETPGLDHFLPALAAARI